MKSRQQFASTDARGRHHGGRRRAQVAGAVLATLAIAVSSVAVLANHGPAGSHLVAVGPISPETGYPVWYKDATGQRLELCLDSETSANPFCGFVPGDIPDPDAPLTVPDNFPEEAFWMLGGANLTTGGGGKAVLTIALEAAFGTGPVQAGDQVSFGRVRVVSGGLLDGATYRVTHPYGTDTHADVAAGPRGLASTDDIGIGAPGDFTGALNSRVGPFVTWSDFPNSPGLPNLADGSDAYIGDPGIDHAIKGSPLGTNVFRIEGPAGSFAGSPDLCADPLLGDSPVAVDDCVETSLFSLMGKVATNAGVTPVRATYARTDADGSVDLFASSEAGQSIRLVKDASFATTPFDGDGGGRYFARVDFTGEPPAQVAIQNASDVPATTKTIAITDLVTVTGAEYDSDFDTLTIEAASSDGFLDPTLTAEGFGDLASGTLVVPNLPIAPDRVTVTSAQGGSDTATVTVVGDAFTPIAVVAGITVPEGEAVAPVPPDTTLAFNVVQGRLIALDATSSAGDIDTYAWEQVAGPQVVLDQAGASTATFTSPSEVTSLGFRVTVIRNAPQASDTKDVTINVLPVVAPVANAGADQVSIVPGTTVTLDGSGSTDTTTYAWTQTAGPAVVLSTPATAKPTFVVPVTVDSLTFELAVTGPGGGPVTDAVTVTPVQDVIGFGRAIYTRSKNEWRIDGTASIHGAPSGPGNGITVTLSKTLAGVTTSVVLNAAPAPVDTAGAWIVRFTTTDANKRPLTSGATYTVSITSTRGGSLPNRAIQVK